MLWLKSFHLVFVITWFAGLFYLPRLFVYHAMATDQIGIDRFKIMERKLYRGIMTPSAILATIFGLTLIILYPQLYLKAGWMHLKLLLILLLWVYHLYSGHLVKIFKDDRNQRSHVFYRWFNEAPVLILIAVVILAIVKPF